MKTKEVSQLSAVSHGARGQAGRPIPTIGRFGGRQVASSNRNVFNGVQSRRQANLPSRGEPCVEPLLHSAPNSMTKIRGDLLRNVGQMRTHRQHLSRFRGVDSPRKEARQFDTLR